MRAALQKFPILAVLLLCSCRAEPPQILGTLEYDRISLPAPAAERITAIEVREGQRVTAGTLIATLESSRADAGTAAAAAQADAQRAALANLEAGARRERIAQAQAQLLAAQAQARDASAYFKRVEPLGRRQLVAAAEVDRARAAAGAAQASVAAAQAALQDLRDGARQAELAQGEAAVRAAQAQASVQRLTASKLALVAPRAGLVDSLPYKLGDQAPVGAPLAVLLVGDAPYARVYLPEPLRTQVQVGTAMTLHVDGVATALRGTVRAVHSEPSFTPYYALSGSDAARLSYLTEIALPATAETAKLPAGLPVRAELARSDDQ